MSAKSSSQLFLLSLTLLIALPNWEAAAQSGIASENQPPAVRIVSPPNGAVLFSPNELLLLASATDPDGFVVSVEFFADGVSLGLVSRPPSTVGATLDESHPELGPIFPFAFKWQKPPPGTHVLTAAATDNLGGKTSSMPVEIKIIELPPPTVVTVVATDPDAAEGGLTPAGTFTPDNAVFTIRRTGPTDFPLDVFFRLEGTAINGKDYVEIPEQTTIPVGEASVDVTIKPLDDAEVEGSEKVVLALLPPKCLELFPPPRECYLVGRQGVASAIITDNDLPPNIPPTVEILHPHQGEVFRASATILLAAAAADLDGSVVSVEFFEGEASLGQGTPSNLKPALFTLPWPQVPAGEYVLTAVATDDQGATRRSKPVEVKAVELQLPPTVNIEAVDAEAAEPAAGTALELNTARFVVRRTGPTDKPLTILYRPSGSALNGTDYAPLSGLVTIPIGATAADIWIKPLPDNLVEGAESVIITLLPMPCVSLPTADSGCYVVGVPGSARAVILDANPQGNLPPKIEITNPLNGQVFVGPLDLKISAIARDPDGWVPKVQFYAGDTLIGEQIIMFIMQPPPGQVQMFDLDWKGVLPGAYVLRAKAIDDRGASSWSDPIGILVVRTGLPPMVTIYARDPVGSEPGLLTVIDTAEFVVHRTGDLTKPLTVDYQLGGTAENGVDYTELPGKVTIPEGKESTSILINPLMDKAIEGAETVVVELPHPACETLQPPPEGCYVVGEFNRAAAKILDSNGTLNRAPKATITRPLMGEIFQIPAEIKIVVEASDSDGWVGKVEFFADGRKIGEQLAVTPATGSSPDVLQVFSLIWSGAPGGPHVLTARAVDNLGSSGFSPPVGILVVDGIQPSWVNIWATDPFASERPPDAQPNTATFRIRRTGATNLPLTVFYSIGGSAENGKDYQQIGQSVTIPAGRRSARITIQPINDDMPEKVETVVLKLMPSPMMNPLPTYQIGFPAQAAAFIVDKDQPQPWARVLPEGSLQISLAGETGMGYRVEASTDFQNWVPISEGLASCGQVFFIEPKLMDSPQRFYRLRVIATEAIDLDD